MSESQRPHRHSEPSIGGQPPAYWRRAHRDWRFWVGLTFMLLAIAIYVLSDNLAFLPRG